MITLCLENTLIAIKKIEILHEICGNTFLTAPTNFLSGHECPFCNHGSVKYTLKEYQEKFLDKENFSVEEIYINNKNIAKIRCKQCGSEMTRTMYFATKHLLKCDNCSSTRSIPVRTIIKFLKEKELPVTTEEILNEISEYRRYLRIDISTKVNDIALSLEFDGLQHFSEVYFTTIENQEKIHQNDLKKNDFFKNGKNGLLVRIKYDCFSWNFSEKGLHEIF